MRSDSLNPPVPLPNPLIPLLNPVPAASPELLFPVIALTDETSAGCELGVIDVLVTAFEVVPGLICEFPTDV